MLPAPVPYLRHLTILSLLLTCMANNPKGTKTPWSYFFIRSVARASLRVVVHDQMLVQVTVQIRSADVLWDHCHRKCPPNAQERDAMVSLIDSYPSICESQEHIPVSSLLTTGTR